MTTIKRIPASSAETKLERHVRNWLNAQGKERRDGAASVYKDLEYGGCQSGFVGHLIYYHDTVRFYRRHQKEIDAMLAECVDSTGYPVDILFREWDHTDPLARDDLNQNILAWFGFEEAARAVMGRAEQQADSRTCEHQSGLSRCAICNDDQF